MILIEANDKIVKYIEGIILRKDLIFNQHLKIMHLAYQYWVDSSKLDFNISNFVMDYNTNLG